MNARRLSLLVSLILATPLAAQAPTPAVREDLDALGSALETAVGRVSRPTRAVVVSRNARGYRLPGYGAMIILAPRALPAPASANAASERQATKALARAAQQLEQGLREVQSHEARARIEQNLKALRDSEAALRRQGVERAPVPPVVPAPQATAAAPPDVASLEREMQAELARQADALQRAMAARGEIDLTSQEELDRELRAMHERAEAFRLRAERALQDAHRDVQRRVPGAVLTAEPGTSPEPPTHPSWQAWFDFDADEPAENAASPEAVMEAVRGAIITVLEAQGTRLQLLGPEEVVAVAVDFIPQSRMSFRPRAQKTLLVRVSKKAIEARRAGRLSPAEFRKRVEVLEY